MGLNQEAVDLNTIDDPLAKFVHVLDGARDPSPQVIGPDNLDMRRTDRNLAVHACRLAFGTIDNNQLSAQRQGCLCAVGGDNLCIKDIGHAEESSDEFASGPIIE